MASEPVLYYSYRFYNLNRKSNRKRLFHISFDKMEKMHCVKKQLTNMHTFRSGLSLSIVWLVAHCINSKNKCPII